LTCSHDLCYLLGMNSVNASYFKTHFGEVLSRVRRGPVRVSRRGHDATVLLSEKEYQDLKSRAMKPVSQQIDALNRLKNLAVSQVDLDHNEARLQAIKDKHTQHYRSP